MSTMTTGIQGVRGREPIGAALTIGIKGPRKAPIEKDRFHLLEPSESAGKDGQPARRAPSPLFTFFNNAPAVKRRFVRGIIAHQRWNDCFEQG